MKQFFLVWTYKGDFVISSVPFADEEDANYHADTLRGRKFVKKVSVLQIEKESK